MKGNKADTGRWANVLCLEETQSSVNKLVVQGQQQLHLPGACQKCRLSSLPQTYWSESAF